MSRFFSTHVKDESGRAATLVSHDLYYDGATVGFSYRRFAAAVWSMDLGFCLGGACNKVVLTCHSGAPASDTGDYACMLLV